LLQGLRTGSRGISYVAYSDRRRMKAERRALLIVCSLLGLSFALVVLLFLLPV
jgi:hypothetical protein